jgi:hypothetical protein
VGVADLGEEKRFAMSFLSNFFSGSRKPEPSLSEVIVMAYGAVLGKHTPAPVVDVSELPYPKDAIKRAILTQLAEISDPRLQKLREHLKSGYLLLAGFQIGVGPTPPAIDLSNLDPAKMSSALAKEMLPALEQITKWGSIVEAEQHILISDLPRLGYWKD